MKTLEEEEAGHEGAKGEVWVLGGNFDEVIVYGSLFLVPGQEGGDVGG